MKVFVVTVSNSERANTVVGVFDNFEQAMEVCHEMMNDGEFDFAIEDFVIGEKKELPSL